MTLLEPVLGVRAALVKSKAGRGLFSLLCGVEAEFPAELNATVTN